MKKLLLIASIAILATPAFAQTKVSFRVGESKYLVSQNVEVGDVPNHVFRAYHTVGPVSDGAATINGLKIVEVAARGTGETADGHGGGTGYLVFTADNGDKFYSRNSLTSQRVGGKLLVTWGGTITGGTGKFSGIQGTTRLVSNYDPAPGGVASNGQFDIEYTMK